ncbi:hypothetical protein, partial [Oceanobacillus alkalisoli]|uniref:hypothetical protein n=1 Tax=Oceanobacillus alkalisoli TaxID=2925113 RepID=UPI001EF08682
GYEPTYRTINRFRSNPLVENILRECFVQFRNQLVEKELIEEERLKLTFLSCRNLLSQMPDMVVNRITKIS